MNRRITIFVALAAIALAVPAASADAHTLRINEALWLTDASGRYQVQEAPSQLYSYEVSAGDCWRRGRHQVACRLTTWAYSSNNPFSEGYAVFPCWEDYYVHFTSRRSRRLGHQTISQNCRLSPVYNVG